MTSAPRSGLSLYASLREYWPLWEATSSTRYSVLGLNNLTDNNNVSLQNGPILYAAGFNGALSQYLEVVSNASLQPGDTQFAFDGYVYMGSLAATVEIFSKLSAAAGNFEYDFFFNSATNRFNWRVSNDGTALVSVAAATFGLPVINTWYYFYVEHDSVNNHIGIQINNTALDTQAHATGVTQKGASFRIGANNSGAYLSGRVADLALHNRTLTDWERALRYNNGKGMTFPFYNAYREQWILESTCRMIFPAPAACRVITETPVTPTSATTSSKAFRPTVIGSPAILPNQRLEIITPGIAEYKVIIKDISGDQIAEFDQDSWINLSLNHKEKAIVVCRFEISSILHDISIFKTDVQVEVWRRNRQVDLDWYLEWEGLYRTPNEKVPKKGDDRFIAFIFGYLHLANRAVIAWDEGTTQADKSTAAGETAIKELVVENIGSLALATSGRERDHIFSGLTVEADLGRGDSWDGKHSYENLLKAISKIASKNALVYDIVGIGDAEFEFRVYANQRGTDRTKGTADPVLFDLGLDNIANPVLAIDKTNEATVVYAIGQGVLDEREVEFSLSSNIDDSPWNAIEVVAKGGQSEGDSLIDIAASALEKLKRKTKLNFASLQTRSSYYGKHYTWGDKVTAIFRGIDFDLVIREVSITVSADVGGEQIVLKFSDEV